MEKMVNLRIFIRIIILGQSKLKKNEIYLQYDLKFKKINKDSNFIKIVN